MVKVTVAIDALTGREQPWYASGNYLHRATDPKPCSKIKSSNAGSVGRARFTMVRHHHPSPQVPLPMAWVPLVSQPWLLLPWPFSPLAFPLLQLFFLLLLPLGNKRNMLNWSQNLAFGEKLGFQRRKKLCTIVSASVTFFWTPCNASKDLIFRLWCYGWPSRSWVGATWCSKARLDQWSFLFHECTDLRERLAVENQLADPGNPQPTNI